MAYLDVAPDMVRDWVVKSSVEPPELLARRCLMREVFRPAILSARWQRLGDSSPVIDRVALRGLKVITARDRREEASLIALSLREAQTPDQTAALVTPDRQC